VPLIHLRKSSSTIINTKNDPFVIFCEPKVQELLHKMIGFDIMKVAGPNLKPLRKPEYKLLTDEQLAEEQQGAVQRQRIKLQIPPYMKPRKPPAEALEIDPELAHFDTCKWVFTDVTFGLKDRERVVTVRDIDGSLLMAPWDAKERLSQMYNPREGRHVVVPAMFNEDNLESMIKEKRYRYILDRACAQFEPDDPQFLRTTHRVFNAVDKARDYEMLWSLRHYGSLAFYLVWHDMMENFLAYMWDNKKRPEARDLVELYASVHPSSQCALQLSQLSEPDDTAVVQAFVSNNQKTSQDLDWKNRGLVKKSSE